MLNWGPEWRRRKPHIHAPGTVMNDRFGGPNESHDHLTAREQVAPIIEAIAVAHSDAPRCIRRTVGR
jgi:hypothetical protein